jgi:hypothetical protein
MNGKPVAFFLVNAAVEIIHTAGIWPMGLMGAGDGLDIEHASSRFGSCFDKGHWSGAASAADALVHR